MQCPRCNTTLPANTLYCYTCGTKQGTPNQEDATQAIPPVAASEIAAFPDPLTQPAEANGVFSVPALPASDAPVMQGGWAEFSGIQASMSNTYPPVTPMPNSYESYNPTNHTAYASGTFSPPPNAPTPKHQKKPLITRLLLSALVLILIFGGVLVGIRIGQAHNSTVSTQTTAVTHATSTAQKLYQQITSQPPTFTDSLQDPISSPWSVFERPTYGCNLHSDGLHVHIQDINHFTYCTSGYGSFSNFAFQIDMHILSGNGGGLTLRGDTQAGNNYYFHIFPDGLYTFYIDYNHQLTIELNSGIASSFVSGQKNTLTVIARRDQMYCYVNQKFLTMIQDSTYTSGLIGVLSSANTTAADVVYTNAKIWRL